MRAVQGMSTAVVALAGNPNTGKTSLFNALTGSRQKVGNWPGVTVERKEGRLALREGDVTLVDLPGVYSLGASSVDEQIAADFFRNERPGAVVTVVDATNLERSLYLAAQLRESGVPVVVALNMWDLAEKKGISVDIARLEALLGVDVVPTAATNGTGLDELRQKIASRLAAGRGAAAMGGAVTMFFTFWGLNALRKEQRVAVPGKTFLDRLFGRMMPRGLRKLGLSRMNMAGIGNPMMTWRMKQLNLPNPHGLLASAQAAGVRIVACSMAMEAMGLRREELLDGVEIGGVADFLGAAEESGTQLFI